ncbi:AEC family transporter [Endozoicomonas sp. OPT23]|uniref:AEC family transporter n=1 Tax=Endozoicomonas sp. OPT23 TaxID=2072845 RepID=UPI00129AA098|nr:AEC family transporter [Endozoicomonas sp. OPT23]MRI32886.1 AEC family transporter [Endozoicomonas sp. OPT23]
MQAILDSLLPIFLLIFLGYTFKHLRFPGEGFWEQADRFTYYALFPALFIYKLSNADLQGFEGTAFISSSLLAVAILTTILVALNRAWLHFSGAAFTSVYQGALRFNSYVFLALVSSLYGDEGLILAAFLITFFVPIINICCISIFSIYASQSSLSPMSFIRSIIKNPLILACFAGGAINVIGTGIWSPLNQTLSVLSSAALPLGLLSVGVGLHLDQIKAAKLEIIIACLFKLLLFPAVIAGVAMLLGVEGIALSVLVLFAALPTASTSHILSRELGGDVRLMSAIITLQTVMSMFTLMAVLSVAV